jgi:uncharacterized protein
MVLAIGLVSMLALAVLGTSFVSGVFGMAGGMILMGVLVALMPVASAMVLHGVAQMTSNGWRALLWRRKTDYKIFLRYIIGMSLACLIFAFIGFVPDRALVLIGLGVIPFLFVIIPERFIPQADRPFGAEISGFLNTALQFVAGVSGPLLDLFFVRSYMDRRVVVATKAACQTITHLAKLIYFINIGRSEGYDIEVWIMAVAIIMAIAGTSISKLVLDRLTDMQFRRWTRWIVMSIGVVYLGQGAFTYLS